VTEVQSTDLNSSQLPQLLSHLFDGARRRAWAVPFRKSTILRWDLLTVWSQLSLAASQSDHGKQPQFRKGWRAEQTGTQSSIRIGMVRIAA